MTEITEAINDRLAQHVDWMIKHHNLNPNSRETVLGVLRMYIHEYDKMVFLYWRNADATTPQFPNGTVVQFTPKELVEIRSVNTREPHTVYEKAPQRERGIYLTIRADAIEFTKTVIAADSDSGEGK